MGDAQQLEDAQVLLALGLPTLGGRDDEDARVDRADAGQHVAEEAHVSRNVDDGHPAPARQRGRRETQIDGEAAGLLLGEAIGVGAGERAHQGRLAVVDVAGGGEDVHQGADASERSAAATCASSCGAMVRRSAKVVCSCTRAMIGGDAARSAAV